MSEPPEASAPEERLLRLLGGKWLASALSSATSLGLIDALAEQPLALAELAQATHTHADSLARLMRVLQGEDVVAQNDAGQFVLTDLGEGLRSDRLGELARFVGAPFSWDPWSSLAHAVRTGEASFEKHHGLPLFDYLDHHPQDAALYHAAIAAFSKREARSLAEVYDFANARRVADLGGGSGTLLIEVLTRWPHLHGILLERPPAVEKATDAFREAGLSGRCDARVGNFFEAVPTDADVCILMHILHSWDDATCVQLLKRCAQAVGPKGQILVIEGLVLPGGRRNLTGLMDLEMLVLCGPGHERRKPEMRRLISAAGLKLAYTRPLAGGMRLLVAEPRPAEA